MKKPRTCVSVQRRPSAEQKIIDALIHENKRLERELAKASADIRDRDERIRELQGEIQRMGVTGINALITLQKKGREEVNTLARYVIPSLHATALELGLRQKEYAHHD